MRVGSMSGVLLGVLLSSSCSGGLNLSIDVRTDLVPGVEFRSVHVTVRSPDEERAARADVQTDSPAFAGVRVVDLSGLPAGEHSVELSLLDEDGRSVLERVVRLELTDDHALTVVLARTCRGIECADGHTCVGGVCAALECSPLQPDACPTGCDMDASCPAPASCAEARCVEGTCLAAGQPDSCEGAEFCDPDVGCREEGIPVDRWSSPGEWSPLELLASPSSSCVDAEDSCDDDSPLFEPGALALRFSSSRLDGSTRVYRTTRSSLTEPFGTAAIMAEADRPELEELDLVERVVDGRVVGVLGAQPLDSMLAPEQGCHGIFLVERPAIGGALGVGDPAVDMPGHEWNPWLSEDGLRLYFAARRDTVANPPCGRSDRIYVAERSTVSDPFGAPVELPLLPEATALGNPHLLDAERIVVFNAVTSTGGNQLYFARRSTRTEPFGAAELLAVPIPSGPFNSPAMRFDGRELILSVFDGSGRSLYRSRLE